MMADQLAPPTQVVFVYGALRSGTTLFRLMLESHGSIINPGEVDFLFDHIARDPGHPTGWRYDLARLRADRIFQGKGLELPPGCDGLDLLAAMLGQFTGRALPGQLVTLNLHRHLDRLMEIVPSAWLIHLVRDPRDVARSSIAMGWAGTLYHGVSHWIDTEAAWDRMADRMAPSRVIDLKYEVLFTDVEGALRRVCAFLGLDYDPAMLGYHHFTSYGPPDATLVNQWRRRATRAELAPLEARAAPLMARRGYELTGPIQPCGLPKRFVLYLRNRLAIWRFGINRFGAPLYIGEKLTRRLRLSALHRRLLNHKTTIASRYLK